MKGMMHMFLEVVIAIVVTSCGRHYYMPNVQQIPIFKEKNEARLYGGYGPGGSIFGGYCGRIEVQGAYSITNKLALSSSYMNDRYVGGNSSLSNHSDLNYGELALGYYRALDEYLVFETYSGFGFATQRHSYEDYKSTYSISTMNFQKYFVQPSIAFTSDWFDIALSTRISYLNYSGVKYLTTGYNHDYGTVLNLGSAVLVEPALTIRACSDYIKAQSQIVISPQLTGSDIKAAECNVSFGVYICYGQWWWDKNKAN